MALSLAAARAAIGGERGTGAGVSCTLKTVQGDAVTALDGATRRGGPAVQAALALGWEMAELYAPPAPTPPRPHAPERLPAITELSAADRVTLVTARLAGLLECALGPGARNHGRLEQLREIGPGDPEAWRRAAYELHVELLTRLASGDGTLARAYEVGRALAELSSDPRDMSALLDRLEPDRLLPVEGQLADLSSTLPPHSAAAVAATLDRWRAWTAEARAREDLAAVRGALARQRTLWRVLLTGQKDAREMLDPDTLLAASVRHATRLGTLIRGLTGAYLPALAALVVSVVLLLWTIVDQDGIATVIAALGALAATLLGIRKSLSLTAQDTIDELRRELWESEVDAAVAQSILRLPPVSAAERKRLSLAKPPPLPGAGERIGVRQRVERALHVTTAARRQGLHVPASGPATGAPRETTTVAAEAATTEQPSTNGVTPHD